MYSPIELTFTLRIPGVYPAWLQLQTPQQALRGLRGAGGDGQEGAGFGGGHGGALGEPGQVGGPLDEFGVAGDGTPAGEGQRVLHADPEVAAGAEGAEHHR